MSRHGEEHLVRRDPGSRLAVCDSVTLVSPDGPGGDVIVCGSHGGVNAALYAASAGARAAVFNDAGVGKDRAGVAGLAAVERYGLAGLAVSHLSARIGDGEDTLACGVVSTVNRWAEAAGARPGMRAVDAVERLEAYEAPPLHEARPASPHDDVPLLIAEGPIRAGAFDSISQAVGEWQGAIVVTGSHGAVVAGRAVRVPVSAAFFNDAGVGKERVGISRLALLDEQSTPAAAVAHTSARIGDGIDTYRNGVISHANDRGRAAGLEPGMTVIEAVARLQRVLGATA